MKKNCIALVFDKAFLDKAKNTINQIKNIGKYNGDIICILSDDLKNSSTELNLGENVIILDNCPEIDRSPYIKKIEENPSSIHISVLRKTMHWHKFYCFTQYFKENYEKCLYLDSGMQIFKPLDKIINLECDGKILAHSDAYPTYEWKLSIQFDNILFKKEFDDLNNKFDLNIDYFQGTMFMFDTSIIEDDTFKNLVELSNIYPNSRNNDQGIFNIYFNCMLNIWQQITIKDDETFYYDFSERYGLNKSNYIMLKYPQT